MTRSIWKYPLDVTDEQRLDDIPQGAEILCVMVQRGIPCLWVDILDTDSPPQRRYIRIFGTGHDIPVELELAYIGSFMLQDGAFVGHVYEDL